ncbi:hypothetical protein SPRA44_330120 [Serratia proteamaculans]|nr:hypothetical protein SPRA44_330120 [Serratia proteamaculans]
MNFFFAGRTPTAFHSCCSGNKLLVSNIGSTEGHDCAQTLQRGLSERHIQLISISGAIGTGLFIGSGKTIALSGTSIVLTYVIVGFFMFMVMRAMGGV